MKTPPITSPALRPIRHAPSGQPPPARDPASAKQDTVELSRASLDAATSDARRPVRSELVERMRREIRDGTYDTPSRLAIAVDRLLEDL